MVTLLIVLRVIGYILFALLLLLLILLLLPVWGSVYWENESMTIRAGLGGFGVCLYPHRKRTIQNDKKSKKNKNSGKKKEKTKLFDTLKFVLSMLDTGCWAIRNLCRHLHIRNLCFHWTVHQQDAASTALAYGRLNAAVGASYSTASSLFRINVKSISIDPDFSGEREDIRHFSCKISAKLYIIVLIGIYVMIKAVFVLRRSRKAS